MNVLDLLGTLPCFGFLLLDALGLAQQEEHRSSAAVGQETPQHHACVQSGGRCQKVQTDNSPRQTAASEALFMMERCPRVPA